MVLRHIKQRVLWQRARDYLGKYQPVVIGITGSSGKSLTQAALACLVQGLRHVRTSPTPAASLTDAALSILGIPAGSGSGWMNLLLKSRVKEIAEAEPDTIVLELAVPHPGYIDWISQKLVFQIGIVTNVGSTNLHLFQDKQMVAHEQASLIAALPRGSYAILNADDPYAADMRFHTQATPVLFGTSPTAHVRLIRSLRLPPDSKTGAPGGFALEIAVGRQHYHASVPRIIAFHQIPSLLAALAAAAVLGVDLHRAVTHLSQLIPAQHHMRLHAGAHQTQLIDDTFDAYPEDALAALHTLRTLPARRRISIIGEMENLGAETISWHKRIGRAAAEASHILIAVGDQMRHAAAEAHREHFPADVHEFKTTAEVARWLLPHLKKGDLILIKGSREMHMEKIVADLSNPT